MKKKGFTLIELLAVIVVLAIIAVIATPMVLNTIEEAKKGSFEQGLNRIIKAAEIYQAKEQIDNPITECRYFSFESDVKEITLKDNKNYHPLNGLSLKGNLPTTGEIEVCKNYITMTAGDGEYTGIYDGKKLSILQGEFILASISVSDENIWTTNKSVIISGRSEGAELQYQLNGTNGKWIKYVEPFTIDTNTKIYARLWDGKNEISTAYKIVTKIDNVAPNALVTANVGNGVSTSSNVTMNAVSTSENISGYTYQWYQVPEYLAYHTKSSISYYPGFTLTPMVENDIEFVRASTEKTSGSEVEWRFLFFPQYPYIKGNKYILHVKGRTFYREYATYGVRHAQIPNDFGTSSQPYIWGMFGDSWTEYNIERIFSEDGLSPGFEIVTGELKVNDAFPRMNLIIDYKDVWVEEVENSSNATISNNLGDLLEGETSQTLTVSGKQNAYYVAKITTGSGLVSYSNKFHVVIE